MIIKLKKLKNNRSVLYGEKNLPEITRLNIEKQGWSGKRKIITDCKNIESEHFW